MRTIRTICLVLAFLAISCSIASSIEYEFRQNAEIKEYNKEEKAIKSEGGPSFSGHCCYTKGYPRVLMMIQVLSVIGLVTLAVVKNPAWSLPTFISALLMFPYWIWTTRWALSIAENSDAIEGFDRVMYGANAFDLATAICLSLLVVYQAALLFGAMRTASTPSKLP